MSPAIPTPPTELDRTRAFIAAHDAPNNPPEYLDGELRELLSFSAFGRNWRRSTRPIRSSVRLSAFTLADIAVFAPPVEMTAADLAQLMSRMSHAPDSPMRRAVDAAASKETP
jgi:hypothetical protein